MIAHQKTKDKVIIFFFIVTSLIFNLIGLTLNLSVGLIIAPPVSAVKREFCQIRHFFLNFFACLLHISRNAV